MPTTNLTRTIRCGGFRIQETITRTADNARKISFYIPRGFLGTLTTRTNDTEGVITLNLTNHGFYVGQLLALHTSTATSYNVEVTSIDVSETEITVDLAASVGTTTLPDEDTEIVLSQQMGFDLSDIEDSSSLTFFAYALHASRDPISDTFRFVIKDTLDQVEIMEGTLGASFFYDGEACIIKSDQILGEDFFTGVSYDSGLVGNPSPNTSALFKFGYMFNDLGS